MKPDNKSAAVFNLLPPYARRYLSGTTEEIRLRVSKPGIVLDGQVENVTGDILTGAQMAEIIDKITENSIYAFFGDINNGFITLNGGHRAGICGSAVIDSGKITAVKDISCVNIRVAKEIKGCGEMLFRRVTENGGIDNTLIVSPPGCGKTTILRDLTRLISDNVTGAKVSLIDERGEIAAVYKGVPQNDVGLRTDVWNGYGKFEGISRAVRSMSPTVIVTDEIGAAEDFKSLAAAKYSGVNIIASAHGDSVDSLGADYAGLFKYAVLLGKTGKANRVKEIICLN
jgi:stage III sporulation protein AA